MVDYLDLWQQERFALQDRSLRCACALSGTFKGHLPAGPTLVRVKFAAEPSKSLKVVNLVPADPRLDALKYPDYFVLGLLDVLMAATPDLPKRIAITLHDIESDRDMTAPIAVRFAGRNGGWGILGRLELDADFSLAGGVRLSERLP